MSDFANLWRDTFPAFDHTFAEPFQVVPRSTGPYVAGGASGPGFTVRGILNFKPGIQRNEGRGRFDANQPDRVAAAITIDFDASVFAAPNVMPAEGDRLTATERGETYEIAYPGDAGLGRVTFHVVRV